MLISVENNTARLTTPVKLLEGQLGYSSTQLLLPVKLMRTFINKFFEPEYVPDTFLRTLSK